ncbi:MAG: GTPase domain-containing protein [Planctomycetaceae bacterium]|nr:GTPase domain-containing protein [Planctomycetaceae bacterium]
MMSTTEESLQTTVTLPQQTRYEMKNFYKVTLVGTEGVGKTSFLGGLALLGCDVLSRPPFHLFASDGSTKQYLNQIVRAFRAGHWAAPTNVTTMLQFMIFRQSIGSKIQMMTLDYPGEDFRKAYNELSLENMKQFSDHLMESDVVLLLIDSLDLKRVRNDVDSEVIREKLQTSIEVIWQLANTNSGKDAKPILRNIDVGICVTKCDRIPILKKSIHGFRRGMNVTRNYVKKRLGDFDTNLREVGRIRNICYFPISAVGETISPTERIGDSKQSVSIDTLRLPDAMNLTPFGYEAIFDWIEGRSRRDWQNWFWMTFVPFIVSLCVIVGIGWSAKWIYDREREKDSLTTLSNEHFSPAERLSQIENNSAPLPDSSVIKEKQRSLMDEELDFQEKKIENSEDEKTLLEIHGYLEQLELREFEIVKERLRHLKEKINKKLVEIRHAAVQMAYNEKSEGFTELAEIFLTNHPDEYQAEKVRELLDEYGLGQMNDKRSRIHKIAIRNSSLMQAKADLIFDFIKEYQSKLTEDEVREMKTAMDLVKRFTEGMRYRMTLKQFGGFSYPEDQVLNIKIGNRTYSCPSNGKAMTINPSYEIIFDWKSGEPIRIELDAYAGYLWGGVETVAMRESTAPDAIELLKEKTMLVPNKGSFDWSLPKFMSTGGYFVDFAFDAITSEEWKAFENYIKPGNSWKEEMK